MSARDELQLGQRVRFSDRLVRVSIYPYRSQGEEVLQAALDLMGISRTRGSRTHNGLHWKLWVPTAFAREHLHKNLSMISALPAVDGPAEGFIVQRSTLQQGGTLIESYDDPATWMDHGTTSAYKVAYTMHRNPIHVLPEHLTAIEATA